MVSMVRSRGAIYKVVAKSLLLYESESWLVTEDILKFLAAFHHHATRRITRMTAKRGSGREWEYPVEVETMDSAGIHPIGVYTKVRKATIAERVACRPVYAMYVGAERIPGTSQMVCWWGQDVVNEPEE